VWLDLWKACNKKHFRFTLHQRLLFQRRLTTEVVRSLYALALIELAIVCGTTAIINFSLGMLVAAYFVPISLLLQPTANYRYSHISFACCRFMALNLRGNRLSVYIVKSWLGAAMTEMRSFEWNRFPSIESFFYRWSQTIRLCADWLPLFYLHFFIFQTLSTTWKSETCGFVPYIAGTEFSNASCCLPCFQPLCLPWSHCGPVQPRMWITWPVVSFATTSMLTSNMNRSRAGFSRL